MILDYKNNQLILSEEQNESFVELQDVVNFDLCSRLRNNKYEIPFIALPIVIKGLKKLGYKINYETALKIHYNEFNAVRKQLESCKNGTSTLNQVKHIKAFINKQQKQIRKIIPDFKFYQTQIDSIVFGIIGKRIIIGNDIGTGKTLTSIVICKYLSEYENIGKCLIMLPASLATNFVADYNKFYKDNKMMCIGSKTKQKRLKLFREFNLSKNVQFLVTNYEKCRTDYESLEKCEFDVIIVDEFHKMKNFMGAKMSINFFKLVNIWKPKYKLPMSGTAIENKLFDLYPIFKLLDDGIILGGQSFFEKNFVRYEEKSFYIKTRFGRFLKTEKVSIGFKNHSYLKKLIRPFIIRKKLHLPVKLYHENIILDNTHKITKTLEKIRFESESAIGCYTEMRQFLCDMERYNLKSNPKLDYLENLLTQTRDKVIVFSFFKCSISSISRFLNLKGIKHITCQGGDGRDALDVVTEFNNNPDIKVLITTDKINYGHNIVSAKWIVHYEVPVKSTTMEQRNGRAYRLGQDSDVHAVTLTIKDTVEEIILEKTLAKKKLIDTIIEGIVNPLDRQMKIDDIDKSIESEIMKSFIKKLNY